jgi:D-tagatose-1,6-bisphosphate aldolase subunit GatZ/KbaZ
MKLGDDAPSHPLDVELVARRTAFLAGVAEATFAKVSKPSHELRYVIGSEVPTPGGATSHDEGIRVTKVGDARRTFEVMRIAFLRVGLDLAWGRVIALVVQPGVEFGNDFVLDYHPTAARHLVRFSETIPMVYEAHSTDYQTDKALQELVRDHFAILKVGPALTFAFREAIFALAWMENELVSSVERSRLIETLDKAVLRQPSYWKDHYLGTPSQIAFARKYSLSDRIRYYWSNPLVQSSLDRLFQNLEGKALPLTLLSQFMPVQSERIRSGQIANTLEALILDKIHTVLEEYTLACG